MVRTATPDETLRAAHIRLSDLAVGERARVATEDLDAEDAALLRAMGLRTHCHLRVARTGQPCIVDVGNRAACPCRIGLAKDLAQRVWVDRLPS
jgi:Fe2+ transport system protein FeoA